MVLVNALPIQRPEWELCESALALLHWRYLQEWVEAYVDADFEVRRRLLRVTYQRYLIADRAWVSAVREMRTWFPKESRPGRCTIGNPGSPIRRLYQQREWAMQQLEVARAKLREARLRVASRRSEGKAANVLLISLRAL